MKTSRIYDGERRTSFGRIPEMVEEIADCELAVIFLRKPGAYEPEPVAFCMPGQLYQKKLTALLKKGQVYVAGATRLFEVATTGGRGGRVEIGTLPGGEYEYKPVWGKRCRTKS